MISLELLREEPEKVKKAILRKEPKFNIDKLIELDQVVRQMRVEVENLRSQKNELAAKAKGGVTDEIREQSREIGKSLKSKETELEDKWQEFRNLHLECPNIPEDIVPDGNKESNKSVREFGKKREFDFPIKNHVELGKELGWFDFEAAVRMTGARFALYKKESVDLTYALTMFMLKNNRKHGFEPIIPPYLVNELSLETASNFPKFRDQVYSVKDDGLYLTPTAEVNLTNLYRDHILPASDLPKRMTAWTSCFRREAGTYGAAEQGLIRIHQFEKVELYSIVEPKDSEEELERMVACAEDILQQLGLHYRVSLLAAQDCSFASAKTFDIEVWMPGQNAYYEVSSCSKCTDFQARRGKIRYRGNQEDKPQLVNTLNASSLALPRLIVAIMETFQQPDGSVEIPEVLKKEGIWS